MSAHSLRESHQVIKEGCSASEAHACPQGPENDDAGPFNACHSASFLGLFEGCFSFAPSIGFPRKKQMEEVSRSLPLNNSRHIPSCRLRPQLLPFCCCSLLLLLFHRVVMGKICRALWDLHILCLAISTEPSGNCLPTGRETCMNHDSSGPGFLLPLLMHSSLSAFPVFLPRPHALCASKVITHFSPIS